MPLGQNKPTPPRFMKISHYINSLKISTSLDLLKITILMAQCLMHVCYGYRSTCLDTILYIAGIKYKIFKDVTGYILKITGKKHIFI
jgi:hypothetical protein